MPSLRLLDTVSSPGSPDRANEDAWSFGHRGAVVIDGATGLGADLLASGASDAAWLARLAAARFGAALPQDTPADLVRRIAHEVRAALAAAAETDVAPWRLPVAGFQMVGADDTGLRLDGLGDCRLFLVDAEARPLDRTALPQSPAAERAAAARAVALAGPLAGRSRFNDHPDVLEALRAGRARYNRPGGPVWTLGAVPEAADHLVSERLSPALPAWGIVCTDGFAALVDSYARYDTTGLVARAREAGLAAMVDELRRIERVEDPDCLAYPRFKQSDDATALLFEVT